MHIESRIKVNGIHQKEKYIFGSDMSEDELCSLAENRAKSVGYEGTYTRNDKK